MWGFVADIPFHLSFVLHFGRKQCLRAVSTPLCEPKVHLEKLPSVLCFVGLLSLVPFCKLNP